MCLCWPSTLAEMKIGPRRILSLTPLLFLLILVIGTTIFYFFIKVIVGNRNELSKNLNSENTSVACESVHIPLLEVNLFYLRVNKMNK